MIRNQRAPRWSRRGGVAERGRAARDKGLAACGTSGKRTGAFTERVLTLSEYDIPVHLPILAADGRGNYVATLKLTPVTDGNRTFAEWWAEFDCPPDREKALAEQIGHGVFQTALANLKTLVRR